MIGKILSPVDASRFSIPNVCDVVHVALKIVSGRNMSHCERVFVPFPGVKFRGLLRNVDQKDKIVCMVLEKLRLGDTGTSELDLA